MSGHGLDDVANAGDDTAWTNDGWEWDSARMVAQPKRSRRPASKTGDVDPAACSAPARLAQDGLDDVQRDREADTGSVAPQEIPDGNLDSNVPAVAAPRPRRSKPSSAKPSAASAVCQADGCQKNLGELSYYHQRNRICEEHLKAQDFTVDGKRLRFCQKCGRPHPLEEFDGKKHSCRKQLEKHNARRRKRQQQRGSSQKDASLQPLSADGVQQEPQIDQDAGIGPAMLQETDTAPDPPTLLPQQQQADDGVANDLGTWLTEHLEAITADGDDGIELLGDVKLPPSLSLLHDDADAFDIALAAMLGNPVGGNDGGDGGQSTKEPTPPRSAASPSSSTVPSREMDTAPPLTDQAVVTTISIKLFGCTPGELPPNLHAQFMAYFEGNAAAMQGYLRPGCVHLTVEAIVDQTQDPESRPVAPPSSAGAKRAQPDGGSDTTQPCRNSRQAVASLVERMLSSDEELWRTKTMLVQTNSEIALVHKGVLRQTWDAAVAIISGRVVPSVVEVNPAVILSSDQSDNVPPSVTLRGINLLQDDCEIVCRFRGQYVPVEQAKCDDCHCAASVRKCCQTSKTTSDADPSQWESHCCGCCVGKLATLTIDPSSSAHAAAPSSSCCVHLPTKGSAEAVTLQNVRLGLTRAPAKTGMVHFDVIKGAMVAPKGGRCLVVNDEAVKSELLSLQPETLRHWMDALGVIFEFIADSTRLEWRFVERVGVPLLHAAVSAGLTALTYRLHSLLLAETTAAAAAIPRALQVSSCCIDGLAMLSSADEACRAATLNRITSLGNHSNIDDQNIRKPSFSLLHRAVQSQDLKMLEMVLQWGVDAGVPWKADMAGPKGLTCLHLAALARDPAIAASQVLMLVSSCSDGATVWLQNVANDNLTPAQYALKAGRHALVQNFGGELPSTKDSLPEKDSPSAPATGRGRAVLEAPTTPRRCKCTGFCPCASAAEPCASCVSSDDEGGCCGSLTGQCKCCSTSENNDDADVKKIFKCASAAPAAKPKSCCGGGH